MGKKKVKKERSLAVNIPPGVQSGNRLKIKGKGEQGKVNGDLYVSITVKKHPIFKRDGINILCDIPVTFTQATLGGSVEVPTLTGRIKLKIPSGTQSHQTFRLKEKGMPQQNSNIHGDQFVKVIVETPTHLNKKQKELLTQFANISGEEVNPLKKKFFHKVKKLFG